MSLAYSEFGARHEQTNYHQTLWSVDHHELHKPGERFMSESSAYIEAIAEGDRGPLQGAPTPRGMVKFAQYVLDRFQVSASRFASLEEVANRFLSYMDFSDPYYLFADSCVELVPNQLKYSYRHKKRDGTLGSVLDPKKIEVFQVNLGYDFKAYRQCMSRITHPALDKIVAGGVIPHPKTGLPMTKEDVVINLEELVYGHADSVGHWIEEWIYDFYQSLEYSSLIDDLESRSMDSIKQHDLLWWHVVVVSFLIWIKSEHALPFLCDYHPIYSSVLGYDKTKNQPYILPESGGEAVVWEWDIYTHMHLQVDMQSPPGTCANCRLPLHCTKLVNVNAIAHPLCSCGKAVDVEDVDLSEHTWHGGEGSCKEYREAHPALDAFGCQRCLGMMLKSRRPEHPCDQSPTCPNTSCNWHAGKGMYLQHLTDRRRMLLTQQRQQ